VARSPLLSGARVRPLERGDLDEVVRIDGEHTGRRKGAWWRHFFEEGFAEGEQARRVSLALEAEGRVVGYLLGDVRAVEFGSEECGWVFAVGVEPTWARKGLASALLTEAVRQFRDRGVRRVRTLVRRDDVPVLSFFRSSGFVGGTYTQLELPIGEDAP